MNEYGVYDPTECRARELAEAAGRDFDRDAKCRSYFLAAAEWEQAERNEHTPKDWQIFALCACLFLLGCECLWRVASGHWGIA